MTTWDTYDPQQYGDLGEQAHVPIHIELIGDLVDLRDRRVLDFGCGEGVLTTELARAHRPAAVLGLDISEQLIAMAKQRAAEQLDAPLADRLAFRVGDQSALPTAEKFDVALCSLMLMMCASRGELHRTCRGLIDSLDAEGRLIATVSHPCYRTVRYPTFHNDLPGDFDYWRSGLAYTVVMHPTDREQTARLTDHHWTLSDYADAVAAAGGAVRRLREAPARYDAAGRPATPPAYLLLDIHRA